MAAYYSMVRRACSSSTALAVRAASSRSFISEAPAINNLCNHKLVAVPSSFHYFSSVAATKPSPDDSLLQIIDSEIKFVVADKDQDCLKIPLGFPFTIEDEPGERTVMLTRHYRNEVIKVLVDIPNPATDDANVNNEGESTVGDDSTKIAGSSIPLVVSVSKQNGLCLEFGVTALPNEISIDSVSIKAPNSSEDQIAYQGPANSGLEENLQNALHKYLENRGIKPSMTNVILEYMINKDHKEYLIWLKNLKCFIKD